MILRNTLDQFPELFSPHVLDFEQSGEIQCNVLESRRDAAQCQMS